MLKSQIGPVAGAVATACAVVVASSVRAGEPCEPAWHPFTSGGQTGVDDLLIPVIEWNGDLVAGGGFTTAGGQTVNFIARWDGVSGGWHPFTAGGEIGVNNPGVLALTVWNGDLVAAGSNFTTAGGETVNGIARWDGSAWHPFTSGGEIGVGGDVHPIVWALTVWNGDLVAGGAFTSAGGQTVNYIARWDGDSGGWHPFTSGGQIGLNGDVTGLTVWNGDLVAAGAFTTAGGQTVNSIARWDGDSDGWHPFTAGGEIGMNIANFVTVWNGDLIAGGSFRTAGGRTVNNIARWDGSAWHPFNSGGQIGVDDWVNAFTVWNGDLIVGGDFNTAGGQTVNHIARWDGSAWHPLTSGGQIGMDNSVWGLGVWNGFPVAGGPFTTAGGQTVNHIARWDGCIDPPCAPADLNCDDSVGVPDLLILLADWGTCVDPLDCPADLDGDGSVGVADLLILLANWG